MSNTNAAVMDTVAIAIQARERINARIAEKVSARLGAAVVLVRWIENHKTGDVPVFNVPDGLRAQARALGLTVE